MKKIFSALFFAAVMATGAFAWTNNIGIGFAVPINSFDPYVVNYDKKTQVGYDLQVMYLGYADKGFTVRASFDLGGTTIDKLYDSEMDVGFNTKEHIGLGYSFIRSKHFSLSLTGGIGTQISIFSKDSDTNYTEFLVILGGDLTAIFRIGSKVGLYANANLGFAPGAMQYRNSVKNGNVTTTVEDSFGLKGGVSFTPSLGLSISF